MKRRLIWFRGTDLRVTDQLALRAASDAEELIAILFVPPESAGPAPQRFLMESVANLQERLSRLGARLDLMEGDPGELLPRIAAELAVSSVHALEGTLPAERRFDEQLGEKLDGRLHLSPGHTLARPGSVRTAAGGSYSVFTPFSRRFNEVVRPDSPLEAPPSLPGPPPDWNPDTIERERPDGPGALAGGEDAARDRLAAFLQRANEYPDARDRMDLEGSSRLSADFRFGTLSPREAWHAVARDDVADASRTRFRTELLWREFNYSILHERPELLVEPFRGKWEGFPWRDDEDGWNAWREGRTGYPVVDASARQLLAEGFVHNRARMVSASFLTKHLLVDYGRGEAHYLEHLCDGDPAQNNAGWQWSAGCGSDAQPWFRIFNPVLQGKKFDPDGDYVRRWVPELSGVPKRWIHEPWNAPPLELTAAGVRLGEDYPAPIVDHREARERFLSVAKSHLG